MGILMILFIICLATLAVMMIVALLWALVVSVRGPSVGEKSRKSMRTQPARYVMDDEDYELSPCELVMKYNVPLTGAEFDRLCFDREYAQQLMDAHFVQQQRDDMDSAIRMHQIAHQTAIDAHCMAYQQGVDLHNHSCEMAQQHAQMHNDMFVNNCVNTFF